MYFVYSVGLMVMSRMCRCVRVCVCVCVCVCVRERGREGDRVSVPDYKFNVVLSDFPNASIYNLSGRQRSLSKCH